MGLFGSMLSHSGMERKNSHSSANLCGSQPVYEHRLFTGGVFRTVGREHILPEDVCGGGRTAPRKIFRHLLQIFREFCKLIK